VNRKLSASPKISRCEREEHQEHRRQKVNKVSRASRADVVQMEDSRSRKSPSRKSVKKIVPTFLNRANSALVDQGKSHIFLAVAADANLVKQSETILKAVVEMSQVPEITSPEDSHCI